MLYPILAVAAISLVSLIGVLTLSIKEEGLHRLIFALVALSVGGLLGDVFIHILPEVFSETTNHLGLSLAILAGILVFFLFEKFLRWKHYHDISQDTCCLDGVEKHEHVGYLSLLSDGLHNLIDGLIIGASFAVGAQVGLATTLAVLLHEIPQEVGDFAVMLHSGFSVTRALWFNFLSALMAFAGLGLFYLLGSTINGLIGFVLSFAAGGFIYIAGSDLVPELHKETRPGRSIIQLIAILAGVALMFLLLLLD